MKPNYIAVLLLIILCGCSGVKHLEKPATAMPSSYMGDDMNDSDTLTIADLEWWQFYTDSTLCHIIRKTLNNNRDILKAAAKVEELKNLYDINKINWLPYVTANVAGDHETNNYGGNGTKKDPEFDLKATINWEINLWGALTWAKRKGAANYMASIEDLRAMRMTLISEVAKAYFQLIALDNELAIVRQTLKTRQESLEQARIRFEGGLTSETVYQQAKVEYATTASLIPDLERKITTAQNAITLLMGEYPQMDLKRSSLILNTDMPSAISAGLPSGLLQRRPDIKAAEHRLSAAMANVGLTYANRFPNLRISASVGFENDELSTFLKSPFTYMMGSITGTLLDFGKNKRKYKASIAEYDQARYNYEQTIITAFTEVSNALSAYNRLHQTTELKRSLRDATVKYVQLAQLQYRAGTLNYIDVLDAQRRYFDAQIGVSNAIRDELIAMTSLYKSLGGGWQ